MSTDRVRTRIAGIGRYLPRRVVTNDELAERVGVSADWLESRCGVRERRWADPITESNSRMGARACLEALEDASVDLADVDLIINASGTPEQTIPDGGCLLQRELGLGRSGVTAMSVHTTCLSFISALRVASAFLETGRARAILVSSSDIGSVGLDFERAEVAGLFGDCAAAVLLTRAAPDTDSDIEHVVLRTFGAGAELTTIPGGGTRMHPNRPGRDLRDCLFQMSGIMTLRLCKQVGPAVLDEILADYDFGDGDRTIDTIIPHQSSRAGLALTEKLGLPGERMVRTLDRLGNCIAASMPSTLYEAVRSGRVRRGDRVLLIGTGAGLSLGGAVLVY